MKNIKAIDFFSGSGGTTQGLIKSGINVIAAVEIDEIANKTYEYNNPEVNLIKKDIRKIDSEVFNYLKNENDYLLLVACPPCQGFSSIRKNGDADERNELIFEYLRFIEELEPDFLLMENVAGMTSKVGKEIFNKFQNAIIGKYSVEYDVLNAADYGVPQTRKRLVMHGIKKTILNELNVDKVELPKKTHSKNGEFPYEKWRTASVILNLPPIKAGEEYKGEQKVFNHLANNLSDKNLLRIKLIREGNGSRDSLPDNLILKCHKKKTGFTDVYGILDPDKPSVTITGGCMSYSKGRFGHPFQDRALSAREAARLQTFDDDYLFFGGKVKLAKQIGNAVPVELARASGNYFMSLINKV